MEVEGERDGARDREEGRHIALGKAMVSLGDAEGFVYVPIRPTSHGVFLRRLVFPLFFLSTPLHR